jgi:transposase-like protein
VGVDQDGQVLECWLSRTRDLAAAEVVFHGPISSTACVPEHVVTSKAALVERDFLRVPPIG